MQNPAFTADKYFRLAAGKPQFRMYRWGGSMSGPVVHSQAVQRPQQDVLHVRLRGDLELRPLAVGGGSGADRGHANRRLLQSAGARLALSDLRSVLHPARGQRRCSAASRCRTTSFRPTGSTPWPRRSPLSGTLRISRARSTAPTTTPRARTRRTPTGTTSVRIDHNVSEKQRFYVRTNFTNLQRPENIRQNLAVGDNFYRYNKGFPSTTSTRYRPGSSSIRAIP